MARGIKSASELCAIDGCGRKCVARGWCDKHYRRWTKTGNPTIFLPKPIRDLETWRTCSLKGCEKASRTRLGKVCEMHYYRNYKTGTYDDPVYGRQFRSSGGYVVGYQPGHPVAGKNGGIYEHRRILFEKIGPGAHPCHWCKQPVVWHGNGKGKLVADHIDGNKLHNSPSNLEPSCHRCNATRGLFIRWVMKHRDDPFLWSLFSEARSRVA